MTDPMQQSAVQNRLLKTMPAADFELIAADLQPIDLPMEGILEEFGGAVDQVVFMETGIASRLVIGNADAQTEGGHIGHEGMTGRSVVLESPTASERIQMQVAGKGLAMPSARLLDAMGGSHSFRKLMLRYVQASQVQSEHTLLAATSYSINERLARWLLMYNDRVGGTDFPVTHDLLATMMNVRRAGITGAMHILEGEHAIRSTRGTIHVLDRNILTRLAGGSYGIPEREYELLIPPLAADARKAA